ncbi:uncharacterized protein LOC112151736 [Oryzias melastigma]|uniref:uncharacterized protein LOC112151736 n=1 Tax=Oryzias melastigma TaxID=30732 RepID=UPI000CF81440|nr:uncharacterized protein LOC112151736 [Oryzias melastigma]
MAGAIARTTQDLTSAADMRNTTQMLMQPNANWEEYLAPGPISVAIMGELVFISSNTDFSINKNPPKDGFKYIKYPESFRACLMQVCNLGWHAFNTAHKNMDQIRIHTANVPGFMKSAVKILFQNNDEIVKSLLPNMLESISRIADQCVVLADGAEKQYADVICLIQELLEACINAEYFYGEKLEEIKMKIQENKLKEQTAKEITERSKKTFETLSKEMEEAQNQYKNAMNSLPSGWEIIGMDVVEGLGQIVTVLGNACVSMSSSNTESSGKTASKTNPNKEGENKDMVSEIAIYSRSEQILKLTSIFGEFINDKGINWKELYDQKNKSTKTKWSEDQFKRISQELEKMPKSKVKEDALTLCNKGIAICGELAKYAPEQKCDEKKTNEIIKDTKKLHEDAMKFDCESKKKSGSPALTPQSPMKFREEEKTGRKSASQVATENARFRIEQSREQLKQTRDSYEKAVQNMEKNQKELTDILVDMQKCKIKEIDFDTTIKMLVKGMDAMGRVKEQWEKMVRFFQMVANIVKTSLGTTLETFVKTSEDTMKLSYSCKLFAKDILYNQAFQASNISSLVHMISGTYCEVSSKYLMDRISSLGKLMAMDKEKPEFMQERLKLQQSCKEAQEGILHLVLRNKAEFERKIDDRIAKIETELKAVLPSDPPQETERIKEIVQSSFGDEDKYY